MQRLLAGALLSDEPMMIHGPSESDDCTAALGAVAQLGAEVELGESAVRITGHGAAVAPRSSEVHVGESGLGLRLFSTIAALADVPVTVTGGGSLSGRPVGLLSEVLPALGAPCKTADGVLPVQVTGPLQGGCIRMDGSLSSQFLTGLLMALPVAPKDSIIEVSDLASRPYIDLTLAVLKDFGIEVHHEQEGDLDRFEVAGNQSYNAFETAVDGDWSAGAALLVAGMVAAETSITVEGLGGGYPQADEAIRGALLFAGGALSGTDHGIQVAKRPVRAFDIDLRDCPDLFPVLAALAAFANKPSRLRGAERLKFKETDRAKTIIDSFAMAGIKVTEETTEDSSALVIHPRKKGPRVQPARIHAQGDHRIAMASAILGLAGSPIEIEGAECVAKSYPGFFDDLEELGAQIEWVSKNP